MPWEQLLDWRKENAKEAAKDADPPETCPIDGSVLEIGNGVRNCPMGNFTYPPGTSIIYKI